MKLDLSKFKKTAEDKHTTTLESPDGHSITIMHSKLPALTREQLKRLKMASGGKVQRFADGTPDAPIDQDDSDSGDAPDTVVNVSAGQSPSAVPSQYAQQPTATQNIPQAPAGQPNLNPNGTMNPGAVAQNTQLGAGINRDVEIAKGQEMANVQQGYTQAAAANAQQDRDNFRRYIQVPTDEFKNYIDANPIDPSHWAESQSTAQKVSNGLALLLGGFATNGGTGQNPAMAFINQQIDRDIQAQKENVNNQKTVLGAYQQVYGDSNTASALAKASTRDIYDSKAKQIAFQLNTPQAWANYQAFAANQAIQKSKDLQEAAVSLPTLPGFRGQSGSISGAGTPGNAVNPDTGQPSAQNDSYYDTRILKPGALQAASGLRHVGYLDQAKLQNQLTQADQAEKVINGPTGDGRGGIRDIVQGMYDDIGNGGYFGGMEQAMKSNAESVPYVGHAAVSAANMMLPQGGGYKDYQSKSTALKSDIAAALSGLVSVNDIDRIVNANSPERGDTQEDVDAKIQNIINTIKKSIKTDELKKAGLVR